MSAPSEAGRTRQSPRTRGFAPSALAWLSLLLFSALPGFAQSYITSYSVTEPTFVALDNIGGTPYLYVSNHGDVLNGATPPLNGGQIIKINLTDGSSTVIAQRGQSPGQFISPDAILVDPTTHNLFIADRWQNNVQEITDTGTFVMSFGSDVVGAPDEMHGPVGLARDGSGAIYVSEHGDTNGAGNAGNMISKYTVSGTVATRAWRKGNGLNTPYAISVGGSNLYISDGFNDQVQVWDLNGNPVRSFPVSAIALGSTFDAAGDLWIAEASGNFGGTQTVVKRDPATGAALLTFGTAGSASGQFALPFDVAVNTAATTAYVADYNNNRVQVFDLTTAGGTSTGGTSTGGTSTGGTSTGGTSTGGTSTGSTSTGTAAAALGPQITHFDIDGASVTRGVGGDFLVTFNTGVTGVDATDFAVNSQGGANAAITGVTAVDAMNYRVHFTYSDVTGWLQLAIKTSGTGIADASTGNLFQGAGLTASPTYGTGANGASILQPVSATITAGTQSGLSVPFTVTFSDAVTGVAAGDFVISGTSATINSVTPVSSSTYTVNTTASGTGTVTLNAIGGATANIKDTGNNWFAGNASSSAAITGGTSTGGTSTGGTSTGGTSTGGTSTGGTSTGGTSTGGTSTGGTSTGGTSTGGTSTGGTSTGGTSTGGTSTGGTSTGGTSTGGTSTGGTSTGGTSTGGTSTGGTSTGGTSTGGTSTGGTSTGGTSTGGTSTGGTSTGGTSTGGTSTGGTSLGGATAAPVIKSSSSITATVGTAFTYLINATNSPTSYSATSLAGTGLMINTTNGLISGVPMAQGTITTQITASNNIGTSAPVTLTITVTSASSTTTGGGTGGVTLKSQTVTIITPVSNLFVGDSLQLSAMASSGLPVTYSIVSGNGTLNGNTLIINGAGSVVVRAAQAGNSTYAAASSDATFTAIKRAQSVNVSVVPPMTHTDSKLTLPASADSGLPITYSVISGPATISGNTLTFTGTGTVVVRASQTGNAMYDSTSTDITITGNPVPRLVNISARAKVSKGDANGATIAGFVVTGSTPKQILIRAVGPGLAAFKVNDALADPTVTLFDANGKVVATNSGWNNDAQVSAAGDASGAFKLAQGSKDAAILATLQPGSYTVQVQSADNSGEVLIEVYDVTANAPVPTKQLINISTRASIATDGDQIIAGFVVSGNESKKVLIRAVGPGLTQFKVSGAMSDPMVTVYDNTNTVVATNDNWSTQTAPATAADITAADTASGAFPLAAGSADAALVLTLKPGQYTAVVTGANKSTGNVLVEVYEVPNP